MKRKVPAARNLKQQLIDSDNSEQHASSSAEMVEQVAERETLVKLLAKLDLLMKRKTMLLDTIEDCHSIFENHKKSLQVCSNKLSLERRNKSFFDHYRWLHENLKTTNQALQVASLHLQVMYGERNIPVDSRDAYADCTSLTETQDKRKLLNVLRERTTETASLLYQSSQEIVQEHPKDKDHFSRRLSSAAGLLLTADITARNVSNTRHLCKELIDGSLKNSTIQLKSGGSDECSEIIDKISTRGSGFKALEDSITMLTAELSALKDEKT